MNDDFVTEALHALRHADAGVETSPEAEIRALLAFRRQRRRQRSRRLVAIGAIAAAIVLLLAYRPARKVEPSAVAVEVPAREPQRVAEAPLETEALPAPKPISQKRAREIATAFYPLMESAPPLERGMLVRVTVPAATMRSFGLPVGDEYLTEPVQADVLVGQDDLARAIRFVSYRKD